MLKKQAEFFRGRWKAVKRIQIQEMRATPISQKLKQLITLMSAQSLFQEDTESMRNVKDVRQRWAKLRSHNDYV